MRQTDTKMDGFAWVARFHDFSSSDESYPCRIEIRDESVASRSIRVSVPCHWRATNRNNASTPVQFFFFLPPNVSSSAINHPSIFDTFRYFIPLAQIRRFRVEEHYSEKYYNAARKNMINIEIIWIWIFSSCDNRTIYPINCFSFIIDLSVESIDKNLLFKRRINF